MFHTMYYQNHKISISIEMFQTNYSHKPQNCKIEFRNAFVFFEYLMLSHLIVEILSVFNVWN